jgi:prefoldin subunit 5
MFRGYDSGQVLREDIIARMKYLRGEINTLQRSMDKLKAKAAAREKRIERSKKEVRPCYST